MWRTKICWLALVLAALPAIHTVFAAGDDYFETQSIPLGERVLAIAEGDLYRDRGEELLLFLETESGERVLRILTQGLGRKYSTSAIAEITLPESVFGQQVVDFDGDGREDLLLLAMDGLYQVRLGETAGTDTLTRLAEFPYLYSIPEPGTIVPVEIVFDLDGDGVLELLLPCWQGVGLFHRDDGIYHKIHQFRTKQRSGMPFVEAQLKPAGGDGLSFRLARVTVHDLNTDRIPDVFVESDGGLEVFYQTGQLQFGDQPDKE
ncbi:MAG: VCBS repeat-containing protein, partial [bacterium]